MWTTSRMTMAFAGAAVATATASAQYTFEMRLIPDGAAGAPTGLGTEYPIGNPSAVTATRIGFWLQARVAQTLNQNWGINRFSRPAAAQGGGEAYIRVNDPSNGMSISRGTVNAANTLYGRGAGYRVGPNGNTNNTNAGNTDANYENGHLDAAGPEGAAAMIYNIDSFVGATRSGATNPWGVNGATGGVPWPSDGTFAPWANLYRVWIDIYDLSSRSVTVEARGLLNGTVQTQMIVNDVWAMQTSVPTGQVATSVYTVTTSQFNFTIIPAPAGAAAISLGALTALRRRR